MLTGASCQIGNFYNSIETFLRPKTDFKAL